MQMNLSGKQILVVGASNDIGLAISSQLKHAGARLVLVDNDSEKVKALYSEMNDESLYVYNFEIYDAGIVESEINKIINLHGKFDGFVYCAGMGGVRPLSFTKHAYLHEMMTANFYSFVEFSRILTKKKNFSNGGSIVAVSSVSSIKGLKSKLAYSASKAALDSSVRSLAAELGERQIRVNSILKAGLTTDKNLDHIKNILDFNDNEILSKQFLGETEPVELANLVLFLLSDAVKTMTGTSIILDGGFTL